LFFAATSARHIQSRIRPTDITEPILNKAELPQICLYDLGYSHATLLLIAEENPKVVTERLGHSTIALVVDTYSQCRTIDAEECKG